jgi:hypothetical protein
MKDIHLVVFGTSLAWGQGLKDEDKIHQILVRMLASDAPGAHVEVHFLAHSGASTGYKPDGSIDTHYEPRVHGEVPTLYPTIVQQIDEFDATGIPAELVRIIVLDAGINDVHVTRILNPLSHPKQIESLVEIYCYDHVVMLLSTIVGKFPNARIFVLGYYEMLTEHSEDGYVKALVHSLQQMPMNGLVDGVIDLLDDPLKERLLKNSDTFASCSKGALVRAAHRVNETLGTDRVFYVDPGFGLTHAAFTADPWLFGINDDLSPADPMASVRDAACESAGPARTEVLFCKKASAGHPNPKGSKAYAEAIYGMIQERDIL